MPKNPEGTINVRAHGLADNDVDVPWAILREWCLYQSMGKIGQICWEGKKTNHFGITLLAAHTVRN